MDKGNKTKTVQGFKVFLFCSHYLQYLPPHHHHYRYYNHYYMKYNMRTSLISVDLLQISQKLNKVEKCEVTSGNMSCISLFTVIL